MNVDRLLALGRCGAVAVSPDGRQLVVAVSRLDGKGTTYVSDLWQVAVEGGTPRRLTWGDHGASDPAFRADGAVLFRARRPVAQEPEDERRTQVWCLPAGGGDAHPLTDEPLGVDAFKVAGDVLATLCPVLPGVPHDQQHTTDLEQRRGGPSLRHYTRMPVRFWDHWIPRAAPHLVIRGADGSGRRDLTPDATEDYRESAWDLAPDGGHVCIARGVRADDGVRSDVLERWDLATGTCRVETWATGPRQGIGVVRCRPRPDAPDVALVERRAGPGAPRLVLLVHQDGVERTWDGAYPHDVVWLDAHHLVLTVDRDGRVPVCVFDVVKHTPVAWTTDGSHEALAVHAPSGAVFGLRHRFTHPPEPFRLVPGEQPTLVARLSGFGAEEAGVEVSELRVAGAEGHPVHAFVVARAGRVDPAPGLLWIHGGPIGAFGDGWHWRWNPLVAVDAGYTVCLPNPRGSTGYGWPFIDGIWDNTWGDACYRDLLAVTDAFAAHPAVRPDVLAAMGGSFGGYMVNWIGVNTDRFRAIVSHAGLWSFSGFSGVTDEPAWWRLELAGAPWTDEAAFNRWSPHRRVAHWRTPVLILHGERDYRVPVSEALQMFDALRAHGVDAELGIFPDENHWILKPRNIRAWYGAWLGFVGPRLGLDVPLTAQGAPTPQDRLPS